MIVHAIVPQCGPPEGAFRPEFYQGNHYKVDHDVVLNSAESWDGGYMSDDYLATTGVGNRRERDEQPRYC